jgi:hypothetical protein
VRPRVEHLGVIRAFELELESSSRRCSARTVRGEEEEEEEGEEEEEEEGKEEEEGVNRGTEA